MAKEPKCYKCEDAFPFILEVLERTCQRVGEAQHRLIVSELMAHPEAAELINTARARCPHLSKLRIASNMIQFMSQHYTLEFADARVFQDRFDRRQDGKNHWAYWLR